MLDFNDAYIFVDEDRTILVMRKLGPLPVELEDKTLSFIEKQEMRPVEGVVIESQLNLTEKGKQLLKQLIETVIVQDAGVDSNQPGRYYLHPKRIETLKNIIQEHSVTD